MEALGLDVIGRHVLQQRGQPRPSVVLHPLQGCLLVHHDLLLGTTAHAQPIICQELEQHGIGAT
eukprot:8328609-Lingulodinium_polyedra.AAC.1